MVSRDVKVARVSKGARAVRTVRAVRDVKVSKAAKEVKVSKAAKEVKVSKASKADGVKHTVPYFKKTTCLGSFLKITVVTSSCRRANCHVLHWYQSLSAQTTQEASAVSSSLAGAQPSGL